MHGLRNPGTGGGGGGGGHRVLIAVCVASVLCNCLQLNGSLSLHMQCQEALAVAKRRLVGEVRAGGKASAGGGCPPCVDGKGGNKAAASSWEADEDDAPKKDGNAHDIALSAPGSKQGNEIGWIFGLERVASKTANTIYDPKNDAALQAHPHRYGRSPVPKGSWKVRVGPNKWITMDEVAFAYDVWFEETQAFQYMSWMGVFVQQDPMDAFAIQDMLWRVKPDLVIEIGTNTGGGSVFYSTIMRGYNADAKIVTLDVVPKVRNWNVRNSDRCYKCTLGTDHKYWHDGMITYINGRVTEQSTRDKVQEFVDKAKTVLVIEDASHRYPDTLENIEAAYKWVTKGSYLLVQDTKMDRFVAGLGRKYGRYKFGPMRSVDEFIAKHDNFVIDRQFEYLLYSQHHRGWLKRTS
jgi:cephalosporin hydroxylase